MVLYFSMDLAYIHSCIHFKDCRLNNISWCFKNSYSKARCVCNASIIFVLLLSNLRNIHDSNASFDITLTFPFYLKYSQSVLQDLSEDRTFSKNFRLFYLSVSVRFTKTNVRSYNWEYKGFKSRQTD